MKARWLIPLALGLALLWVTYPTRRPAVRLPTGNVTMPAWQMTDLSGLPVSSTNFSGKVLVLNFWATWCPPCREELPDLNAFHGANQTNGVVVIGASVDEGDPEVVKRFAERNGLKYPIVFATPEIQLQFGNVTLLPTTFVIDREGRMAARFLGAITREELEKAVEPLVGGPVIAKP